GQLLSVSDQQRYLLIEMPHRVFVDLLPMVQALRQRGLRTILAHPEREPEFLYGDGQIEALIEAGCLVQVSASSVTDPRDPEERQALRSWFNRGVVHLLASDGHSPTSRPPLLAAAYREITRWVGPLAADRIASTHGMAVLAGRPLRVRWPAPRR